MKHYIIGASLMTVCISAGAVNEIQLTVQDCREMARQQNVEIKNTHLDYLAARTQKREAQANYYPVISLDAVGFQSLNPLVKIGLNDVIAGDSDAANNLRYYLGTSAALSGISTTFETLSNAYRAGVTLVQPVYSGGRIVNSNHLAALGVQAATLKENIAIRNTVSEVENKYWKVVSLEEKAGVLDEAIALADSLLKDTRSAHSAGLLTDEDSDKVIMKRQDLKAKRIRLKGGILLARMDLCETLGLPCSEAVNIRLTDRLESLQGPDYYWKDPAGIVDKMDENKLLELAVKQKDIEKQLAMGEALPQIGVGATYGYSQVIGAPQANGSIYATVKIPLTDWSKAGNKMKRMEYQREKAENDRSHYAVMLELQLRQYWIEVEACWEEISLKEENVFYAEKAVTRTDADVSAGLATVSELMEKRVDLANAKCEMVDARIAYWSAVTEYKSRYQ